VCLRIDEEKIAFIQASLTCTYFSMKCFMEGLKIEVLEPLNELACIALQVPDHSIACSVYEIIGIFNKTIGNHLGAMSAFHRLRDISQDYHDKVTEMEAYLWMGKTLQVSKEYSKAILAFKRIL